MNTHTAGGLLVGFIAVAVGVVWIVGAFTTRRRRATFAPTYSRQGGPVYTALELGCSSVVILAGLTLIVVVLATR